MTWLRVESSRDYNDFMAVFPSFSDGRLSMGITTIWSANRTEESCLVHALQATYHGVKRTFDVAFSTGVLVTTLVPSVLLGVAVALESPGGPLFRQTRVGKGGKEIHILKFRTMYADSHEHPERYLSPDQLARWKREQKVDDDPRVTRLGKFLRRTSLDELPQFLNVFLGDMSVVGPRPVTLAETYEFGDYRDEVLSVRPGITGWWQVTDRNNATWANGKRQERELWYVRNASLATDARIIFKTLGAMARGTGK